MIKTILTGYLIFQHVHQDNIGIELILSMEALCLLSRNKDLYNYMIFIFINDLTL
jgi:hypothetical protein